MRKIYSLLAMALIVLGTPASRLNAQNGCTFVGFQCAYQQNGPCASYYMGYAVYDCGGTYVYQEYGCCKTA